MGADHVFAWPQAHIAVMGAEGAVKLLYSDEIRKGVAETLVLLGILSEDFENCSKQKVLTLVNNIIRSIFSNTDWRIWASLNSLLPIIAEAAPETFLSIIEENIRKVPNTFSFLFKLEGNGITGWNYMTGLLWALETLAWKSDFLARTTIILCHLSNIDPGGNWVNRPKNSIISIFLPWMPQTIASADKRINTIKTISNDFPIIAWSVLLKLLPNQYQTSSSTKKPIWRTYIPDNWKSETNGDKYWQQIIAFADLAVEMSIKDEQCRIELIKMLQDLPEKSFDKFIHYLNSREISSLPDKEKIIL